MHKISRRLLYYKRKDIQRAIVTSCKDREVGVKYETGFGKRPDVLIYENDVLELVKKGATSFHISEELWSNPLQLSTELRKSDLNNLRIGWDLVLDIDCPYWFFSKLTTHLFIKALKQHAITAIGCKFSGNKGFHIGVSHKLFPEKVNNVPVKTLFPDGPKRIALYLLDYISNNFISISSGKIVFDDIYTTTIEKLANMTKKTKKELSSFICPDCKRETECSELNKEEYICSKCSYRIFDSKKFLICPKCKGLMHKIQSSESNCVCGSTKQPKEIFNPLSIINVDTLLISSRHMYRVPYSMHEKSDLVSVPIEPDEVLKFEKKQAEPDNVLTDKSFINTSSIKREEAKTLIIQAFDFQIKKEAYKKSKVYDLPETAIPEEFFPPSIKQGLEGLQDGKKRFLFILINFLSTLGWTYPKIEELVYEWNSKNPEPLKQNYILGQLRYVKAQKKVIPPPNYTTGIYKDLGLHEPENIVRKYKNPVTYAKILFSQNKGRKLTKKQKEMRKNYRERLKNMNSITNKDETPT